MKARLLPALVTFAVLICSADLWADKPIARAVSLKTLDYIVKTDASDFALRLCGITRINGFIIDSKNKDLIIFGEADTSANHLYLDDLVTALRNVKPASGGRQIVKPPICSIDPDPEVLRQLLDIDSRMKKTADPEAKRKLSDEYIAVGRKPQLVRIEGVPIDTHFADVMVKADYEMKSIADGSSDLKLGGFKSLMDIRVEKAEVSLKRGDPLPNSTRTVNRFWFVPAKYTYSSSGGVVMLQDCRVELLTEEQFLSASGLLTSSGRPDPLAKQFAESFSANYDRIAEIKPIYRDLRELYRLVGLAKLLKDSDAFQSSGANLDYLLSKHRVQMVPVSRNLPGIASVREITASIENPEETIKRYLWLSSIGGVNMDVRPTKVPIAAISQQSESGKNRLSAVKSAVLGARKSAKTLYWDFKMPD